MGKKTLKPQSLRFFIYSQIKEFGALVFAATMNVRQVVSILVSYAAFAQTSIQKGSVRASKV